MNHIPACFRNRFHTHFRNRFTACFRNRLSTLLILLAALAPVTLRAQPAPPEPDDPAEPPLETTRRIADKIIRETRFSYEEVPFTYNAGVSHLRVELPPGASPFSVVTARAEIRSAEAAPGFLGLSWAGDIAVELNGKEVFSGTSAAAVIREYTYNRFRFTEKVPVEWKKGVNTVEVRGRFPSYWTPLTLLMMPVDELDARPPSVEQVPAIPGVPGADWEVLMPWEESWRVQPVPVVRELEIPETNSYVRDAYSDWHYANGGTLFGILSLFDASGDSAYFRFVTDYMENLADNRAHFREQYRTLHTLRGSFHRIYRKTMLDDTGGPAIPLAELTRRGRGIRQERLLPLLDTVHDYVLNQQERLGDGTFSRPEPEPATVWADDLFMSVPFFLRMAEITGDETLYDDIVNQVVRFNHYLRDARTGLYYHGWYNQRQENTPVLWGRANGWVVWATSEALLHLPEDHPGYRDVLAVFRAHMEALAAVQSESGMWHQVLDHPETWQETSCTAMFALGMARGARMGWLDAEYGERALRAWNALQEKIRDDGTVVDICRGTGIGEDLEFYATRKRFDHDPRGLGAMLTAGVEIHRLLESQ